MLTMKSFKYVMPFYFSVFLSAIMSIVMSLIHSGTVAFPSILLEIGIGIIVSYAAGFLVPISKAAKKFADMFISESSSSFVRTLLESLVYALFYTVIFSFLFTAIAIGFPPFYLRAVLSGIPLSFVIGYAVSLLIQPIALKLAYLTCSKPLAGHERAENEDSE
ncbi:MAG: DUF2798 domain-containing protein [Eubacteriaceae bacterium]|nr:DUF2798 domain-containing protein [Eubacteriaceae bacterium]